MYENAMNLNIFHLDGAATVKFHPYRTAMVYDRFLEMKRSTPEGQAFEQMLAKHANAQPDNHTAYTIELGRYGRQNPPHLYVMCSDDKIAIGTRFEVRNW